MAQNKTPLSEKKNKGTAVAADKKGSAKKTDKPASGKSAPRSSQKAERVKKERDPQSVTNQILPFVFVICAILILLVLLLESDGWIVRPLKGILLGFFSGAAYIIPVLFLLLGFYWQSDVVTNRIKMKLWCAGISLVLSAILMHLLLGGTAVFNVVELYKSGVEYESGGIIGGLLASLLIRATGTSNVLAWIITVSALFISTLLLFGLTPRSVQIYFAYRMKVYREKKRAERSIRSLTPLPKPAAERVKQLDSSSDAPAVEEDEEDSRSPKFDPDVDMSADKRASKKKKAQPKEELDQEAVDQRIFDEVMRRTRERYGEQSFDEPDALDESVPEYGKTEKTTAKTDETKDIKTLPAVSDSLSSTGEIDLSKIFIDPEKIELLQNAAKSPDSSGLMEAERDIISVPEEAENEAAGEPEADVPVYEFPPLSLLAAPGKPSAADLDELKNNASKLVDTLRSFNVKTRVSDVSRGPTITRYELTPESGTRVRSISNLSDDIALGLAVPNIRIEAPIPGKAAVGIEVPNKKRENVYLRALLENEAFETEESRLTCALGADVAGSPIYCDIAKMPHLLIAGATGTGKSVCINSIIMSLLYKSTPQEIRLIMIDPKKVELTIYNGIPHLHVPVVSDVKKAAGTLAWAVTEMERRYELIESVGVRNIKNYNKVTYNDPEKEYLPQMVIIIDEFADLMMTVKDDVETSVCRIAQMGRAAGIHLIIGTQRPSVNVVTGLIKANIPSRIAFTMSSQIDSRTVIDVAGAEKLLGRGDMLYIPTGSLKPQRVQGAFVSDAEVQKIIDFLKGICPDPQYDAAAIDGIEAAAARCGRGNDGGEAPVATDDPMLRQALELAVETGKISTSLIQRRLSLGYGRAAKLIDTMEARGFVSAPDGQRPRDVLITRQQFQELVLHDELG